MSSLDSQYERHRWGAEMTANSRGDSSERRGIRPSDVGVLAVILLVLAILASVLVVAVLHGGGPKSHVSSVTTTVPSATYPVGVIDVTEPSGLAPPGPHALSGYQLRYVTDFTGTKLPTGWEVFTGIPGGDPGGQFGSAHVVVNHGMLLLNTWKDTKYGGKWVTGGLSQYGVAAVYGAYFIRSRVTGVGPNEVQLLWPADNTWPPEIDFNESGRGDSTTTATVHWGKLDTIEQHSIRIDLTEWHTWGVIWTAHSIIFAVDGHAWADVTKPAAIPRLPMNLDLEQRSMCSLGFDCPTAPESMQVDWIAEYVRK